MDPKSFRAHAHELVDWMADYLENAHTYPVVPQIEPGQIRAQLPGEAPQSGEPFEAIWRDFQHVILPGMTHWNHPGWFAYFPANNSPPSILAEMLTATLGAQCMSWQTSPAATELEQVVMRWLAQMLGLPVGWTGVIQDTASSATLVALLSARERFCPAGPEAHGLQADGAGALTVYASDQAHSSVDKAVRMSGIGLANLRRVATGPDYAMCPEDLARQMDQDLARGLRPAFVVATVGTTASGAIDPLPALGEVCEARGVWLHVDAAWAGAAAIAPEHRAMLGGLEKAHSFLFNPHKWLLTNFDCTAYFVREPAELLRAFALTPDYLKTAHDAAVVNYRDWGIALGRRFRALKLWFVLRSYGVEGLVAMIRDHVAWARELRARFGAHPAYELVGQSPMPLLCVRLKPRGEADEGLLEALNQALVARMQAHGEHHLTHARLDGRLVLRISIGQYQTRQEHIDALWQHFEQAARDLCPTP